MSTVKRRAFLLLWVLVPAAGIVEMAYHARVESRVPRDADWESAAAIVEQGHADGDLVVITPWWASQGWKWLGRFMTVAQMSREDDWGYGRIWEVALPGRHTEEYEAKGKLIQRTRAGRLTVRLWQFPEGPTNVYDFVAALEKDASVSMIPGDGRPPEPCSFKPNPTTGIVPNSAVQSGKFRCDPRLPWNYVAREVIADLDNKPRLCLWAHPIEGKRIRIEFGHVPAGRFIEGHTGLKYEADRETAGKPPVFVDVIAGGKIVGTAMHEEGGGWTPFRFDLGAGGTGGSIAFEVHSPMTGMAHFCFSAKLRDK